MLAMKQKPAIPDEPALQPIDADPRYRSELEKLGALEARLRETRARRQRAQARGRGEKTQRSVIARAADLVSGGRVPPINLVTELEACTTEEEILLPAIAAQVAVLDDVRGELELAACNKLRAENDAALRALLRAVEDAYAAIAASAAVGNRLRANGYRPRGDVLPALYPPALVALGDPDNPRSPAARFKESLRERGIVR
jgi:hypothetical protein